MKIFSPSGNIDLSLPPSFTSTNLLTGEINFTHFFTALLHENIVIVIILSTIAGLFLSRKNKHREKLIACMQLGERITMQVFSFIMYYAPIAFFCYFAAIVNSLGSKIIGSYLRIGILYYSSATLYFILIFTGYAYLAANLKGIKLFWKNVFFTSHHCFYYMQ